MNPKWDDDVDLHAEKHLINFFKFICFVILTIFAGFVIEELLKDKQEYYEGLKKIIDVSSKDVNTIIGMNNFHFGDKHHWNKSSD